MYMAKAAVTMHCPHHLGASLDCAQGSLRPTHSGRGRTFRI